MKKARCKFTVSSICQERWGGPSVMLNTEYDDSIEEDQRFTLATPTGEMKMKVDNPALKGFFKLGKQFYVDLIPVEPEE